jgi:hypothetical protein
LLGCSVALRDRPCHADGVSNSIPIHERVELPESWIPADSRVEIDAKINAGMVAMLPAAPLGHFLTQNFPAGYFTTGHRMTEEELKSVQGRIWEE